MNDNQLDIDTPFFTRGHDGDYIVVRTPGGLVHNKITREDVSRLVHELHEIYEAAFK